MAVKLGTTIVDVKLADEGGTNTSSMNISKKNQKDKFLCLNSMKYLLQFRIEKKSIQKLFIFATIEFK